jgi:hypothetical protein
MRRAQRVETEGEEKTEHLRAQPLPPVVFAKGETELGAGLAGVTGVDGQPGETDGLAGGDQRGGQGILGPRNGAGGLGDGPDGGGHLVAGARFEAEMFGDHRVAVDGQYGIDVGFGELTQDEAFAMNHDRVHISEG